MGTKVETMSVSLAPGTKARIEEVVVEGGFTSSSEIIRAAVADWLTRWDARAEWTSHVRSKIRESIDAYERGDYRVIEDVDAFFDELEEEAIARKAARTRKRAAPRGKTEE